MSLGKKRNQEAAAGDTYDHRLGDPGLGPPSLADSSVVSHERFPGIIDMPSHDFLGFLLDFASQCIDEILVIFQVLTRSMLAQDLGMGETEHPFAKLGDGLKEFPASSLSREKKVKFNVQSQIVAVTPFVGQ